MSVNRGNNDLLAHLSYAVHTFLIYQSGLEEVLSILNMLVNNFIIYDGMFELGFIFAVSS